MLRKEINTLKTKNKSIKDKKLNMFIYIMVQAKSTNKIQLKAVKF